MKKRILIEASGSPVSSFMIQAIQDAGHIAVGSDIDGECAASVLADEFIIVPKVNDPAYWSRIEKLVVEAKIDVVVPSLDETLIGWAERAEKFASRGVRVLISPVETLQIFQDKWAAACFFDANLIPAALSSLDPIYPLVKPRFGRGSAGVYIETNAAKRKELFGKNDISQTILSGVEFTVDCLFDADGMPVFVVPRRRARVVSGKSMSGVTESNDAIFSLVNRISTLVKFVGPINIQCFVDDDKVYLVEINPRVAGGLALGMAATRNWIPLLLDIIDGKPVEGTDIEWGMRMYRTYREVFTS